jgi:hypothetical protein
MQRIARGLAVMLTLGMTLLITPVWAQRGDDSKRLSKNGKTEATIDGVDVVVEFGRPSVKDRKVWGGLVPYERIWRTGADECTTITLSKDVTIEGETLPAGTYGLFTIPGEEEWTVVFNTVADQWGSFNYDESKDALRVQVVPRSADFVETLDFEIADSEVILRWEELAVPFSLAAAQ